MSYLLILTFGSPQHYIGQARRTQDLLQGSRILSHLADKAVDHVVNTSQSQPGIELIYPIPQDKQEEEIAGTPNRIVVNVADKDVAIELAEDMEKALHDTWNNLSGVVYDYFVKDCLPDNISPEELPKIWKRQVESWLSVYWVVREWSGDDDDYHDAMKMTNAALASRKMLRNFGQITEDGRKCSITGEHEALHEKIADDNGNKYVKFWNAIREDIQKKDRNLSLFSSSERLSAIATIKRLVHERHRNRDAIYPSLKIERRFPSTSSIASVPFKFDVLAAIASGVDHADELQKAVEDYITALLKFFNKEKDLFFNIGKDWNPEYFGLLVNSFDKTFLKQKWVERFRSIDGDFLYDDTLISTTIKEYSGNDPEPGDLKEAQKALENLIKVAKKCGIVKPQPYYVILSMDGDKMGKLLESIGNKKEHKKFSETLSAYGYDKVVSIVQNKNLGRVVYAGGDDVLAILPIRNVLKVANDLRLAFAEAVDGIGITATASTGLAFVHHTHNLQEAVHEANSTQKDVAKDAQCRDAIAVRLLRRSGEEREMQHDWVVEGRDITERIQELVEQFASGKLARSLPYDVSQIQYAMANPSVPPEAIKAELSRVIKRRLPQGKKDLANGIARNILALADNGEMDSVSQQWLNVLRWLELARFIAQSIQEEEKS